MIMKRTTLAILIVCALTAAASLSPLNPMRTTETDAVSGKSSQPPSGYLQNLVGTWKLIDASVTPDFLNASIPINSFDASGRINGDSTYTIEANGAFFGSTYAYLGRGDIAMKDGSMTLTIDEGVITVNEKKKKRDRKGRTISGTYEIRQGDTLHVEAVKEEDGIRYTFNLRLVNS